jgi:crotonobetainyl-CoA:carnitine CoA-transferase CaiB-like acyl-CoA transferase
MSAAGPEPALLTGRRVIDFSHLVAGPMCTMLLADAGAEVIKVEPPWGDSCRIRGLVREDPRGPVSSYLAASNRGKQSIAVDLKTAAGLGVVRALVGSADIVVENFGPGVMARLGLGLDELRAANPRLVTASVSLFGAASADPRLRDRRGVALIAEAESGLAGLCVDQAGDPVRYGMPMGDTVAAMTAFAGVLMALLRLQLTGQGSHVDVSMVSALHALNGCYVAASSIGGDAAARGVTTAPYGFFRSGDGHVAIGVNVDPLWAKFAAAIGRPELADDPRYRSYLQRDQRVAEIGELVTAWTAARTGREIVDQLDRYGVPCGVVSSGESLRTDPTYADLDLFVQVTDGYGGTVDVPANPFGLTPADVRLPFLGQHSRSVLRDVLGLPEDQIAELIDAGAVVEWAGAS